MIYLSTEENWEWTKTLFKSGWRSTHAVMVGKVSGISPVRDSCEILGSCATVDQAVEAGWATVNGYSSSEIDHNKSNHISQQHDRIILRLPYNLARKVNNAWRFLLPMKEYAHSINTWLNLHNATSVSSVRYWKSTFSWNRPIYWTASSHSQALSVMISANNSGTKPSSLEILTSRDAFLPTGKDLKRGNKGRIEQIPI